MGEEGNVRTLCGFCVYMKYVLIVLAAILISCTTEKQPIKDNIPKELVFNQRVYGLELVVYKIKVDGVDYLISTREGAVSVVKHSK